MDDTGATSVERERDGSRCRVVVFDIGDTLIRVLPFEGPMAFWQELQVIDGVHETLSALKPRYPLVIASNAGDSDAALLRVAATRVGIDRFIDAFFTPQELEGAVKPEPDFFHRVQAALGVSGDTLIMVGDGYQTDVLGAVGAGWRAVWFTPAGNPCPDLTPAHNAEITKMRDLHAALQQPLMPALAQCRQWLAEHQVPAPLLAHLEQSARVAYLLGCWLRADGKPVDPLAAQRGALLHDLCKVIARSSASDHARDAHDFLLAQGQPALAGMALRHKMFDLADAGNAPRTWEERLVYLADKLVEGGAIVPLEERVRALQTRYPEDAERLQGMLPALNRLLTQVSAAAGMQPGELLAMLRLQVYGSMPGIPKPGLPVTNL